MVDCQFQVNTWLQSSESFLGTGKVLTLYGGTYSGATDEDKRVYIKEYNDSWRGTGIHTSYSQPFTVSSFNNSITLYFFIEGQGFSYSPNVYGLSGTAILPDYVKPTAPTWTNITPNPCDVNNKPTITWGGAVAGSSGQLLYDVEVRSTIPSGGWTNWLRISNSQTTTSYYEIYLRNMNIYGQTAYVGVQYQYRIRVYDGVGAEGVGTSDWRETSPLSVTFALPTAPNVTWNTNTIKRKQGATVNWSGANGGSGTITNYLLYLDLMPSTNGNIIKRQEYTLTGNSFYVDVPNLFSEAKNGNYIRATMYTNNSWGQRSMQSNYAFLLIKGNQIWIKINGSWKEGECYIKINGAWKEGVPYLKVNGNWKEST